MENDQDLLGPATKLSDDTLKKMVALVRRDGVTLRNWWIYGQPAPDAVEGVLEVSPNLAPGIVKELLELPKLQTRLDIFPIGIVIDDRLQIRFKSAGRRSQ